MNNFVSRFSSTRCVSLKDQIFSISFVIQRKFNSCRLVLRKLRSFRKKVARCSLNVDDMSEIFSSLPFPFFLFFKFSARRICCIKDWIPLSQCNTCPSRWKTCVCMNFVRVECLNVHVFRFKAEDKARRIFSRVFRAKLIGLRDYCKLHSWIDRILGRQTANDLSIVLASLVIGREKNFDRVRNAL